jgi:hypothetical protein
LCIAESNAMGLGTRDKGYIQNFSRKIERESTTREKNTRRDNNNKLNLGKK